MRTDTTIEVEASNGEMIEVVIEGVWENFTGYNRAECGQRLVGIEVVSPEGFKLTERQREIAEESLVSENDTW